MLTFIAFDHEKIVGKNNKEIRVYINMEEESKYLNNFCTYAIHDQFDPNVDIENIYSKECVMEDDCGLINNDFHPEFDDYTYEQIKNQYAFGMTNGENESFHKSNTLLFKIFGDSISHHENEIDLKDQKQENDVAQFFYLGKNKNSRISSECSNANQPNIDNFENDENMLNYENLDNPIDNDEKVQIDKGK